MSLSRRAHECLRLLMVPHKEDVNAHATPKAAIEFFSELEIYPGKFQVYQFATH